MKVRKINYLSPSLCEDRRIVDEKAELDYDQDENDNLRKEEDENGELQKFTKKCSRVLSCIFFALGLSAMAPAFKDGGASWDGARTVPEQADKLRCNRRAV